LLPVPKSASTPQLLDFSTYSLSPTYSAYKADVVESLLWAIGGVSVVQFWIGIGWRRWKRGMDELKKMNKNRGEMGNNKDEKFEDKLKKGNNIFLDEVVKVRGGSLTPLITSLNFCSSSLRYWFLH
jgi:hypothetical protein